MAEGNPFWKESLVTDPVDGYKQNVGIQTSNPSSTSINPKSFANLKEQCAIITIPKI